MEPALGHGTAVLVIAPSGAAAPRTITALGPARVTVVDGDQSLGSCVADLPAQVEGVVVCEVEGVSDVAELVAVRRGLADADACVRARPVTDAVKVVHSGRVVGAVDRARLTHVGLPAAVRRSVVTGAVAQVGLPDVGMLTSRLLDGGSPVRLLGATERPLTGGTP